MEYKRPSKMNNRGFTLVELIVVLVILAILAALLVPALLGYIDKAKNAQILLNAKNLMNATQAELSLLYAQNGSSLKKDESIIPGTSKPTGKGDCDATNTDFAKKVLETADLTGDDAPYCFMIAVGRNCNITNNKITLHDKYTVYYALYIEKEDSPHMYFYGGDWSEENPRYKNKKNDIFDQNNMVVSGPWKGKHIQYYSIANKYDKPITDVGYWRWLKREDEP